MRTHRLWMAGVVPLLFALVLAACGNPAATPATPAPIGNPTAAPAAAPTAPATGPTAPAAPTAAPTAAPGGGGTAPGDTLRWSVEGLSDLTSLDPAKPGDAPNNTVIGLIFSGLVRLDDKLEVQPDGASDWKVSDDRKTYTFTIRDGLKFGDGTPVTAGDFVYSINRALAPDTAAFGASSHFGHIVGAQDVIDGKTKQVAGVKALDDKSLQITLDAPIAYFLALLTYSYAAGIYGSRDIELNLEQDAVARRLCADVATASTLQCYSGLRETIAIRCRSSSSTSSGVATV